MMKLSIKKYLFFIVTLSSLYIQTDSCDYYAPTIFVPRQMAYNPIYEDALVFHEYAHLDSNDYKQDENRFLMSVKPIYNRTVGKSLKQYFNINHACSMSVQELGSGDIDSLWFQVISQPSSYYSSTLSFNPIQKTYGATLYFACILPKNFAITVNTAVVKRKTNMRICEQNISGNDLGQVPEFSTITQAFQNPNMKYGRICGTQSKSGFDDIQIKIIKNFKPDENESMFWDMYGLLGIPTGSGSTALYLFEPLVGSQHVQLGLGLNAEKSFKCCHNNDFSLYGEFKWRYGLKGQEVRSFDMTPNGQWSRYMLFTTPTSSADPFFAINDLTFESKVTPRNSIDLLLAAHAETTSCSFELGYNFWYRQSESVCPCINLGNVGIADLVDIAQLTNQPPVTVTTSSQATISQGVYPNKYQMPKDSSYTLVTDDNINVCSGAQQACLTNAVFGSIGYHYNGLDLSINAAYEASANNNTASTVSIWANIDIRF